MQPDDSEHLPVHIRVVDLQKQYGGRAGQRALRSVGFTVPKGQIFGLMGPSGCGKSTTLGVIAGFVEPDAGQVHIGDQSVLGIPPHKRGLPMVFQDYALFPHLSVRENVGFSLKLRGTPAARATARVTELLRLIGLEHKDARLPVELSGGEQQRVALARALAIGPEVVLLDEPLSNLDAKMRQQLRRDIRDVLNTAGVTAIFVTHDQAEAFAVCDRVGVMFDGEVHQIAVPSELYRRPRTMAVARFVGEGNFLDAVVVGAGDTVSVDVDLSGPGRYVMEAVTSTPVTAGARGHVLVRPESVRLAETAQSPTAVPGVVRRSEFLGPVVHCQIEVGARSLMATVSSWQYRFTPGQSVWLTLEDALFLPAAGPEPATDTDPTVANAVPSRAEVA